MKPEEISKNLLNTNCKTSTYKTSHLKKHKFGILGNLKQHESSQH